MDIISWVLSGLLIGAIARLIFPGKQAYGFFGTIGVGIAGAIVGGWLGTFIVLPSFLLSLMGACILIYLLEALKTR